MDAITRAINSRKNMIEKSKNVNQTWEEFEAACRGRKVFLFGAGAGTGFFRRKYQDTIQVCGVIDNNVDKQGKQVGDFVPEVSLTKLGDTYIGSMDEVLKHAPDSMVILITSLNYFEEIAEQLEKNGIKNVFALLIMEANDRKQCNRVDGDKSEWYSNPRGDYAEQCCQQPIQKNKIVFKSFGTYSDHGKYITEQLLKYGMDLDIVWIVSNMNEKVPDGVRLVFVSNWKQYIYEMETAYIWVINTIVDKYIKKREGQIYIHTKHWASITLKRFYLDASTIADVPEDVELWKHNGQNIDYMITGSKFDEASCRRGFMFDKEFIDAGSPRTDAMFHKVENRNKIYGYYNIPSDNQTVLYAPTYRYKKGNAIGHRVESRNCELDYTGLIHVLESTFGGEWNILLRLHPSVAKESKNMELPDGVIDVSDYGDSQELCAACDILISDYSSIMFEPAFVKKPVFLFATDKEDYIDKEYDLLIDYNALPFPRAESNEELIEIVKRFDLKRYEESVTEFLNRYGVHEDGNASKRAAEFILSLL